MAETLVELIARIKADATELEKGLTDAEKKTEVSSKKMAASLKTVGKAMAASGAVITAALGLMGKAALDEEINIKRLATTINNSGTAYDSVKDSMEALIATTQRKTGIADNDQRDILGRLVLITQDYNKALELLPTVLDLAAVGEMDASTAATYLGKAFLDLQDGAEEVTVRFGQASLQFKSMEDIQNRVAGAAENLANPLSILKASMGDVAEAIGANLLPVIKPLIDQIVDIAIKVQEWAAEHPVLAKNLTLVALGLGVVLTIVGGLILILPALISGIAAFGVVLHVALGPVGLISLAIAGLITIGILLWQNWDNISAKAISIWNGIADFFRNIWTNITGFFKENWDKILTILFPSIGLPILIAKNWGKIVEVISDIWNQATTAVSNILNNLSSIIIDFGRNSLDWLRRKFENIISPIKETWEWISQLIGHSPGVVMLGDEMETMGDKLPESSLKSFTVNALMPAVVVVTQLIEKVKELTLNFGSFLVDALSLAGRAIILFKKQGEELGSQLVSSIIQMQALTWQIEDYTNKLLSIPTQIVTTVTTIFRSIEGGNEPVLGSPTSPTPTPIDVPIGIGDDIWFGDGGIFNKPSIIGVGESGPEAVVPLNEGLGGITINFTQPVFFDREETMNRFVDMISKGIDRKQRLRFGGAYSG